MIPDPEIAARVVLLAKITEIVGSGEILRFSEAMTHPSYANESRAPDNQRLEFLGDAVLGLCVSELLSANYPNADEGALTRMRSALVNADALARWARTVDVGSCLSLGRGARASGERDQTNVLADAVEAIVAAVYEALGLDAARALVREVVREPLAAADLLDGRDPKSELQERLQSGGSPAPIYRVVETRGPPHEPIFVVAVILDEQTLAQGEGKSKRLAERAAAAAALEKIRTTT
ncbi:MAG: ribonuclease III [Polyangiaceae bacterium]